jgi:glycosyltransferase involved in cell wall biosynthesis
MYATNEHRRHRSRSRRGRNLTVVGPLPPPVHGQSMATDRVFAALAQHFSGIRLADTSEGEDGGWRRTATKLHRSAVALRAVKGADAVYISVNVGRGMWLSTAAAAAARVCGARLFLHHHSYSYVRERARRMLALTRMAGPAAHHIVLSASMADDLRAVMPEVQRILVLGNAALVDRALLDLPLKGDGEIPVLGHLSNLRLDKGLAEVIDLASALRRAGNPVRLVVAGPTTDPQTCGQLDRAARELGELFEYVGPVSGAAKYDFYRAITHFAFPSRYIHEAVPLVLYEAMAAGAVCLAIRRGSIAEQLAGSPGLLADSAASFVAETLPMLADTPVSAVLSAASRQAYLRALALSEQQLEDLALLLTGRD